MNFMCHVRFNPFLKDETYNFVRENWLTEVDLNLESNFYQIKKQN
jgi:hypothetical protein